MTRAVLTDAFDENAWAAVAQAPLIEKLALRGRRLYPHVESLCADLFASLFKLNDVLTREGFRGGDLGMITDSSTCEAPTRVAAAARVACRA